MIAELPAPPAMRHRTTEGTTEGATKHAMRTHARVPRSGGALRGRCWRRVFVLLAAAAAMSTAPAAADWADGRDAAVAGRLPTVVSTNLCADLFALGLADSAQLLSVSARSQDGRVSPLALRARDYPANGGSAEEIVALRPDVVLASRRWQARHQAELFARHGIRVVVVPFPLDWPEIFAATRRVGAEIGRADAAEALLADVAERLARLDARRAARAGNVQAVPSALYLRPNGGSAGARTYVDAVFVAAGVRNHAAEAGQVGWGRFPLERLVTNPPDVFVIGDAVRETGYARSSYVRHAVARRLLESRPVVTLDAQRWGCSNWLLVEAAEAIADQVDAVLAAPAQLAERLR
ncbi:MAG: ABC transporter substrate-binding protein [Rhodocyclaceae bacterium]